MHLAIARNIVRNVVPFIRALMPKRTERPLLNQGYRGNNKYFRECYYKVTGLG